MKKKADNKMPFQNEPHKGNNLSDVILGGQDGVVNTLGVILGVAAASSDSRLVLAAGMAAAFAESVSMAAVAYTSKKAEHDYYLSEIEREKREIRDVPHLETEEIREIFKEKGFEGKLLEDIVKVIISNEKVWLDTMMRDELLLSPVNAKRPYTASVIVGLSALAGALLPIVPFIFFPIIDGIYLSIGASAVVLFIVGAVKAKLTVGSWGKSGLEMTLIGIVSAMVGYGVGLLFKV